MPCNFGYGRSTRRPNRSRKNDATQFFSIQCSCTLTVCRIPASAQRRVCAAQSDIYLRRVKQKKRRALRRTGCRNFPKKLVSTQPSSMFAKRQVCRLAKLPARTLTVRDVNGIWGSFHDFTRSSKYRRAVRSVFGRAPSSSLM